MHGWVANGRFKAIDALRRCSRFDSSQSDLADRVEAGGDDPADLDERSVEDDHLWLIFTCCHPALAHEAAGGAHTAYRVVCGLTTEEIASAFLCAVPTVAQRIVPAKAEIRNAGIAYQMPPPPRRAG